MHEREEDSLDRAIARALGPDGSPVRAPEGFVSAVEARLYFTGLLDRRARLRRSASMLAAGSAGLFVLVLALFVQSIDVPGWVLENVPGVLGRLDAIRVGIERSPGLAFASVGAVLMMAAGVLSAALRPSRN